MIPLNIKKPLFFFCVRKGRRVNEDQTILSLVLPEPVHTISPDNSVSPLTEPVQSQVQPHPFRIGCRKVNCCCHCRTPCRSLECGASRIPEKIEEFPAAGFPENSFSDWAVIKKQPRIQVISKIDKKGTGPLPYLIKLSFVTLFLILFFSLLSLSCFQKNSIRTDTQYIPYLSDSEFKPFFRQFPVNCFRWSILLNMNPFFIKINTDIIFR